MREGRWERKGEERDGKVRQRGEMEEKGRAERWESEGEMKLEGRVENDPE